MNFTEVMDRVAMIIEQIEGKKPYDKTIARYLGLSPTSYANLKKRNSIPFKELMLFCGKHKVSMNWVVLNQDTKYLMDYEDKIWKIKILDRLNASCGGGGFADEPEEKFLYIDKESAMEIGIINPKNIIAIKVIGDSMYPTIKEDSLVLIDKTQTEFREGKIFLINTTSGIFVKRLSLNPSGGINLISDNNIYSTITLEPDEIQIMGKVVGTLEKK